MRFVPVTMFLNSNTFEILYSVYSKFNFSPKFDSFSLIFTQKKLNLNSNNQMYRPIISVSARTTKYSFSVSKMICLVQDLKINHRKVFLIKCFF